MQQERIELSGQQWDWLNVFQATFSIGQWISRLKIFSRAPNPKWMRAS